MAQIRSESFTGPRRCPVAAVATDLAVAIVLVPPTGIAAGLAAVTGPAAAGWWALAALVTGGLLAAYTAALPTHF